MHLFPPMRSLLGMVRVVKNKYAQGIVSFRMTLLPSLHISGGLCLVSSNVYAKGFLSVSM